MKKLLAVQNYSSISSHLLIYLYPSPSTAMDIGALAAGWKGIEESQEASVLVNDMPTADQDAVRAKLAAHDVAFVTKRDMPGK